MPSSLFSSQNDLHRTTLSSIGSTVIQSHETLAVVRTPQTPNRHLPHNWHLMRRCQVDAFDLFYFISICSVLSSHNTFPPTDITHSLNCVDKRTFFLSPKKKWNQFKQYPIRLLSVPSIPTQRLIPMQMDCDKASAATASTAAPLQRKPNPNTSSGHEYPRALI